MADLITIDMAILKKHGLLVDDYMFLLYIYSRKKGINIDYVSNYGGGGYNMSDYTRLSKDGWIHHWFDGDTPVVEIRDKTYSLFEGDKDLFLEWFNKYPIKVGDRILRPGSDDTILGRKLRKKWNKLFKNNAAMARKAIDALETEMEIRRKTGSFPFMQMATTWLNQGTYELYFDSLGEKDKLTKKQKDDFL